MPNVHVVTENFASKVTIIDTNGDGIKGIELAKAQSLRHDTDFVVLLMDGAPVAKFVDGEQVKL